MGKNTRYVLIVAALISVIWVTFNLRIEGRTPYGHFRYIGGERTILRGLHFVGSYAYDIGATVVRWTRRATWVVFSYVGTWFDNTKHAVRAGWQVWQQSDRNNRWRREDAFYEDYSDPPPPPARRRPPPHSQRRIDHRRQAPDQPYPGRNRPRHPDRRSRWEPPTSNHWDRSPEADDWECRGPSCNIRSKRQTRRRIEALERAEQDLRNDYRRGGPKTRTDYRIHPNERRALERRLRGYDGY